MRHLLPVSRVSFDRIAGPQRDTVSSYFKRESLFWREIYQRNGLLETIHQERLRIIIGMVQKIAPAHSRVLDIGCGAGLVSITLARLGFVVDAADPVPEMLELARQGVTAEGQQQRVSCLRADIQHLPFTQNSYDVCVAAGVLPWVSSSEQGLREMRRVVKPGGHLVITTNNFWGLRWLMDPLTNPVLKQIWNKALRRVPNLHVLKRNVSVEFMSGRKCRDLIRSNGLRLLENRALGFGPFSLLRHEVLPDRVGLFLHKYLQKLADKPNSPLRLFGAQHIWLAEKLETF